MLTALSIVSNPADLILNTGWSHRKQPLGSLWLGSKLALDRDFMDKHNITRIISLCPTEHIFPAHVEQYSFEVEDHISHNRRMIKILPGILDKIHQLRLSGHNVLVHCRAGMQRAATVVAKYLEKYYYQNRIKDIIKKIKTRRPIAFSNGYTFKDVLFT